VPAGARLAIVRNPHSGTVRDIPTLEQALRDAAISAAIFDIPRGPLDEWIDRLATDYDVIAVAGGDGTVSAVAAAVARANKILAVIPTGTMNHFARDVGIPLDLAPALALLRDGAPGGIDVAFVNHHLFLNNVSLGSYPRMVHERAALERRGRSRRIAGIVATAKTWFFLRSVTAVLSVDGRELIRRSPFIVVGNGSYLLSGFALTRRRHISDQQLSLYVAPRAGRLGALSLPLRALLGTLDRYEQFEILSAKQISIELSQRHVLAAVDGEIRELALPLRFTVKPGALQVMLPP
jgi:diacylglycerol kinase family enzyme